MIVENAYLDEIEKIWKGNNKGYIGYECNQRSIKDENMQKIVYKENEEICGYAVLYFGKDFCKLEGYPNKILYIPDKVAYIWEIVTEINHLRTGVATNILEYIKTKYKNYTIYSCINLSNIPSLKLHEKMNFKQLYKFKDDENSEYVMMKLKL